MWRNRRKEMIAIVFVFALWESGSYLAGRSFFPSAHASAYALLRLLMDGTIWPHFIASLYRVGEGTLLGMMTAAPVGLLIGQSKRLNDYLGTILNILYPVPKVVFLPVIVVGMGIGDAPKIFLIALVLFFQVTVVIRDAARNIPAELSRSMTALGANKLQYLYHLVFQACLPDVMTALRGTIGVSTAMLFITENFASSKGLGYYITKCMDRRDYENMYAGILALITLGLFLYGLIGLIERRTCRWKMLESSMKEAKEKMWNGCKTR